MGLEDGTVGNTEGQAKDSGWWPEELCFLTNENAGKSQFALKRPLCMSQIQNTSRTEISGGQCDLSLELPAPQT